MDNGFTRKKHPIAELLIVTFFMLALPKVIFNITSALLRDFTNNSSDLVFAQAEAFAGIIGSVFSITLYMTGFLLEPFMKVAARWYDLIGYLQFGLFKLGFRSYFRRLREDGINLWLYIALMCFEVFLAIDGFRRFFVLTGWLPN